MFLRSSCLLRTSVLAAGLLVAATLLSCRPKKAPESLLIAGSTTMAAYLRPVADAFAHRNPGTNVVCDEGGASAGLVALKRGAIDVALLSRDLVAEEDNLYLRDYLVARDGVAIVVHPNNPVKKLRVKELTGIFSGETTSWKAVGGPDQPIRLLDLPKGERARKSLQDLLLSGEEPSKSARVVGSVTEMASTVAADVAAIGYLALRNMSSSVAAIAVDGVEMSRFTMLSGRYPLTRSFYLVTYQEQSRIVSSFVEFALSREGQDIIAAQGLIPVR
jgi:phosphate transport system substrate-binding protein